MELTIRQEKKLDYTTVFNLIQAAFEKSEFTDHREGYLVQSLRRSSAFIPELSLVAVLNDQLVGHILLSKIKIRKNSGEEFDSLALAPVSVHPKHQKKGIGGQLIMNAHDRARELGHTSIVLLGHADYYPQFGYRPAHHFDIQLPFEAPLENCMAIELDENALSEVSGMVIYPEEFYQ